jgi:putative pyruvate formate lyase activating enzyme
MASYVFLTETDWNERIRLVDQIAAACTLCPRKCKVNRLNGERGFCGAPGEIVVSGIFPHFGEEPPVSGTKGSGTIFFSYCTLKCIFCQNYQISHEAEGQSCSPHDLARKFITLQEQGCHNINLVTATHFLPWILRAIKESVAMGLSIPFVYNNGGYETPDTIKLLEGIVDIYLPDMKYGCSEYANLYSHAADYVEVNQKAVAAMFRQAGNFKTDKEGIATRGLCIRHLVLPSGRACSEKVLEFLMRSFDPEDITISLMAQYKPLYRAAEFSEISKTPEAHEYDNVKKMFEFAGITGFYQEFDRLNDNFCIDFKKQKSEPLKE